MKASKLVWTDGLFLTQHHFQQHDRYQETMLDERLEAAARFAWGVRELEVNPHALANGLVIVTTLAAIFPDGTRVSWGKPGEVGPPPREIGNSFPAHIRTLPVYIALAHETAKGANVELESGTRETSRYVADTTSVPDYNTGGGDHEVRFARPRVRILLGDEFRDSYDRIQIAELVRTQSGQVILRDTYVPPILRLNASPFVAAGFRRVLTAMTSRQRALSESRRQRTSAQVEFQASDVAKFWLLHTLNESIPVFTYVAEAKQGVTAEMGYLQLATLIGKLCTFSAQMDPSDVPRFDYLALGDSFEPMFAQALSLIDAVIKENYLEIPLVLQQNGTYVAQMEPRSTLSCELFIAVQGRLPDGDVRDRFPQFSKVASHRQLATLLTVAVPGLRLEVVFDPPGSLPLKPGVSFYRVRKSPDYWRDVEDTATLALFHPFPKESLSLTLYGVDPRNL